jgi:hypothetical protein
MPRTTIADFLVSWDNLLANVQANAAEVPDLAVYTAPLRQVLTETKDITARLDARRALKQQDSRDRRVLLHQGVAAAARLRAALKAHYGLDSERLIEYGSRPLRPRKRAKKNPPPQSPQPQGPPQNGAPEDPTAP